MITVIDLKAALGELKTLRGRTPETAEAEREGAFAKLSQYRDGGIFAAKFSGESAWERHPNGDEIVQIVEGKTTVHLMTDDGPHRSRLAPAWSSSCRRTPGTASKRPTASASSLRRRNRPSTSLLPPTIRAGATNRAASTNRAERAPPSGLQRSGVSGSSPNSTRPVVSNTRGFTPICWVIACTSRNARSSGQLV